MLWLDSQDASHPEARVSWFAQQADVILRYAGGVATVDADGERQVWQ